MRFLTAEKTYLASCIIVALGVLLAVSCEHTVDDFIEATSIKPHVCDTAIVYFEEELYPVLLANCTNSGCHDTESQTASVDLSSYEALIQSDIVNLSEPVNSKLYQVIRGPVQQNGNKNSSVSQMPPAPAQPLSDRIQAQVLNWIRQGARDTSCPSACDTVDVGYTSTIKPLINTSCLSCHLPPEPAAGMDFTQYEVIRDMTHHGGFINNPRVTTCDSIKFELWLAKGTPED